MRTRPICPCSTCSRPIAPGDRLASSRSLCHGARTPSPAAARYPIQGFPNPEFLGFLLDIMPHLIQFQDDGFSRGLRLLVVRFRKRFDLVEYRLSRDPQEEPNAVHRHATQVPQDGVDLHRERLTAWGGAGKLVLTLRTELLGLAGGRAVVDKPITPALGTCMHCHPPLQTWA